MEIEKHIKNLEKYCEDDDLFEKDGDFKEFCDGHIADIKAVIEELKNTQSDLYEANNCISDLLDVAKEREKMIDLLVKELYKKAKISKSCYLMTSVEECMKNKNCYECLKKNFEKRCKNAKD